MDTINPQSLSHPSRIAQASGSAKAATQSPVKSLLESASPLLFGGERVAFSSAAQQLLEQSYQQLSGQALPAATQAAGDGRPTPEQSAGVILNFITARLTRQAEEGASGEELQATFEQGLAGFRKGLEEARSILENLGRLDQTINEGIAGTEQQVLDGLQSLAEELGLDTGNLDLSPRSGSSEVDGPGAQQADEGGVATNSVAVNREEGPSRALRSNAAYLAASIERRENVELEIQTRDGDIITLSLNNASSQSASVLAGSASSGNNRAALLAYQQVEKASSQFSFTVQGELDEEELKALELLLADISSLSEEFFSGNFDEAFEQALSLQLDPSEFTSLSLDLSLLTRASVFAGVAERRDRPDTPQPAEQTASRPASTVPSEADVALNKAQRLLDLLGLAGRFAKPQALLTDLLADRLAQLEQPAVEENS